MNLSQFIYIGVELTIWVLLLDIMDVFRPSVMVKVAFMLGSSKQGKARRAWVVSNWVAAKYLLR